MLARAMEATGSTDDVAAIDAARSGDITDYEGRVLDLTLDARRVRHPDAARHPRGSTIRFVDADGERVPVTSDEILQSLVNGLMLAFVYALLALGLTVVFGILHVVNFVHGHLLLIAAYLPTRSSTCALYWLALPAAVAAVC